MYAGQRALIATPRNILAWAWERFGERCCVLSSMQDAVVIELALRTSPRFPIVFLNNGYHFGETWDMLHAIERHYRVKVEVVGPLSEPRPGVLPGQCCDEKPALLEMALQHRDAWVTGIRRQQTEHRRTASILETDGRGLVKVNPLVQWSDADHGAFIEAETIIQNPLVGMGYGSVGCEPCTSPSVDSYNNARSGRWAGSQRTECGIHS